MLGVELCVCVSVIVFNIFKEHLTHVGAVLERLQKASLRVKPTSASYLLTSYLI